VSARKARGRHDGPPCAPLPTSRSRLPCLQAASTSAATSPLAARTVRAPTDRKTHLLRFVYISCTALASCYMLRSALARWCEEA
jgi:hypothetical protein